MIIPEKATCKGQSCADCQNGTCVICEKEPARHRDPDTHRGYCDVDWRAFQTSMAAIRDQLAT